MQISLFDGNHQFIIDKPIRLIELFAGIGAQAKALSRLGANFEHYRICEFDKHAVQSYNAIHGTNFTTSDIRQLAGRDLGIIETDKYCYIMTYSFPCQDLSKAGKGKGMNKGGSTRSGLLWEVERLLDEIVSVGGELPQVLLMENVPDIHGEKNAQNFAKWMEKLERLGYHNYYRDLNAKDFGIPQNRDRCFMVSVLGDYYYDFPKPVPLQLRLKDMLESKVDEKYYLSEKVISSLNAHLERNKEKGNGFGWKPKDGNDIATTIKTEAGYRPDTNFIKEPTILTPKRTEYGKAIRKDYEAGLHKESRHNFTQLEPKQEHTSNTITTVQKDNLVIEPTILQQPHGFNKGAELATCPSITTSCWESNNLLKEPIIYDDFNQRVKADQSAIGTLTTNYGATAERNGTKIIEPCYIGVGVHPVSKKLEFDGYHDTNCPTLLATDYKAPKTIQYSNYRIRKLTPKECWRLMGFSDKDFYAAQSAGVSNSQLYKQAGNSIVVNVLTEIFKQLF